MCSDEAVVRRRRRRRQTRSPPQWGAASSVGWTGRGIEHAPSALHRVDQPLTRQTKACANLSSLGRGKARSSRGTGTRRGTCHWLRRRADCVWRRPDPQAGIARIATGVDDGASPNGSASIEMHWHAREAATHDISPFVVSVLPVHTARRSASNSATRRVPPRMAGAAGLVRAGLGRIGGQVRLLTPTPGLPAARWDRLSC
jgi:hypothetical protein